MAKKSRTMQTPVDTDLAAPTAAGKRAYWKQILPQAKIEYTSKSGDRRTLDFDETYLKDLASAFEEHALDQVPFLLADADNRHTMDPERFRGQVTEVRLANATEAPGLYGKIVFDTEDAAKAVMQNPNLGVSARIREGLATSTGKTYPRAMIHVLGTLDPQVSGMGAWTEADLSVYTGSVLDLSSQTYSERADMAKATKGSKALSDFTEADIDAMTPEQVEEFMTTFSADIDKFLAGSVAGQATDDVEDEADEVVETPARELEPALSNGASKDDLELARQTAATATSRANEALRRMADAEWRSERQTYLAAGVPPHLLDLAAPVLNRADDMVVDLSNSDEADINLSETVRAFLDAAKGTVDLSNESGHGSVGSLTSDNDDKILAAWSAQAN